MVPGDYIEVRLYGGHKAVRRLIAIRNDRYVICSEEEYRAAEREKRPPLVLAFPKADVIGPATAPNSIRKKGPQSQESDLQAVRSLSTGD